MRSIPFFAPTRSQPLASIVDLPDLEALREPAIAMLPSIRGERVRIDAYRDAARTLADDGHPVLRFDYPGYGADPGPEPDRLAVVDTMRQAIDWFRTQTGLRSFALSGGCAGGLQTLLVAAGDGDCQLIVVQGERLRPVVRDVNSPIAAGVAAVGWGPTPRRARDDKGFREYDERSWNDQMLTALDSTSESTRIVFIYGHDSAEHHDLEALQAEKVLSAGTLERIEAHTIGSGSLNTTRDIDDVDALRDAITAEVRRVADGTDG